MKFFKILFLVTSVLWAAEFDKKQLPPGELSIEQTPLFVLITFDDNNSPSTIQWLVDTLNTFSNPVGNGIKANHDGEKLSAMWFNLGNSFSGISAKDVMLAAIAKGHEVGNHTLTHNGMTNGFTMTSEEWMHEIQACEDVHTEEYPVGMGLKKSKFSGFRAPRLEVNDAMFETLEELGYLYDSSIEDGFQDSIDGTNFFWPYKLANAGGEGWAELLTWGDNYQPLSEYPNLWEIPIAPYIVNDSIDALMAERQTWYSLGTNKMTGFDYNIYSQFYLNTNDLGEMLKLTLDKRLEGNRAPFVIGLHSDNYGENSIRNDGIFEFIRYALQNPEVRFVTPSELIRWMDAPVALDGTPGALGILSPSKSGELLAMQEGSILRLEFTSPGVHHLQILNSKGQEVLTQTFHNTQQVSIDLAEKLTSGQYLMKLSNSLGSELVQQLRPI